MPQYDPAHRQPTTPEPLIIPHPTGEPAYLIHQQPTGAVDTRYQTPPGVHLVAGPDGRPAYILQHQEQQPMAAVSPLLINAALGVALLLGVGAGLWMIAAFVAALAELLQALAMVAAVVIGGAIAMKILAALGGGGSRFRVDVQATAGRGRRRVHTRTRVRRR